MVGGTGATSNHQTGLIEKWNRNNKDVTLELENALSIETSGKLFDTLAEWNEYLQNHAPYFQEPSL